MTQLLTALLILVPAPGPDEEPTGPAPTLQFLKYLNGKFEMTKTVMKSELRMETFTTNINGKEVVQARTVAIPVAVIEKMMIEANGAEVYGLDGKKVDESVWQKSLGSGAIVLVAHGQLPHATYRKALREGTLIVMFKPTAPVPPIAPILPVPVPKR